MGIFPYFMKCCELTQCCTGRNSNLNTGILWKVPVSLRYARLRKVLSRRKFIIWSGSGSTNYLGNRTSKDDNNHAQARSVSSKTANLEWGLFDKA